jgi:ferredoxin
MGARRAHDATHASRAPRDKRRLRRAVQLVVLALFLILLTNASAPMLFPVPVDFFLLLSPLNALVSGIAGRALFSGWWAALIVLVLTLPLGRYFCGWVCPFGTTLDITDRILARVRRTQTRELGRKLHHVKYFVLVVLVALAAFSVNLAGWFDPLSWATRLYGLVIHPAAYWLAGFLGVSKSGFVERYAFHPQSAPGTFPQPYFDAQLTILVVFVGIALLGLIRKRFYCRVLCPLGAIFAIAARLSPFRRKVSDACTECGRCVTNCKMGAIGPTGKATHSGECILCLDCEAICPTAAIAFDPRYVRRTQMALVSKALPTDFSRRELIAAIVGGIAVAPLLRIAFAAERPAAGEGVYTNEPMARVIRPPGVVDERALLAACVRCGECMKVCPTNAIQPMLLQQGLESVWTPMLVPRIGYCEYQGDCRLCIEACPTRALGTLTAEEKKRFVLGKSRVDRNACIPWRSWALYADAETWSDEYNCGVCEEHCPSRSTADGGKAIRYDDVPGPEGQVFRRIYVDQDVCVGCGHCEHVCPVEGTAAIRVTRTAQRGPSPKISGEVEAV